MIHLRHSAAPTLAQRRRRQAGGSAACTLLLTTCTGLAAWLWPLPPPGTDSCSRLTVIPFTPAPVQLTAPRQKLLPACRPNATPELPPLPIACAEYTTDTTAILLGESWEADDVFLETDAEALLHPPRKTSTAPAAQVQKIAKPAPPAHFTPPAYLRNPSPPYPPALRRLRVQGQVGVRIDVAPDGTPTKVCIIQPSGHAALDRHTRNWILHNWHFSPATRQGKPVAAQVSSILQYTLTH